MTQSSTKPSWSLRGFSWLLRIYLFYVGLILLLVTPALNYFVPRLASSALNRDVESELLVLNPFNLALDVRGVSIVEADGHVPLAFDRVQINLSLSSLWASAIVLDGVFAEGLALHVLRYADGGFHFDDLLGQGKTDESAESPPVPPVLIQQLRIQADRLSFTDRTKNEPYQTTQRDLVVNIANLGTAQGQIGEGSLQLSTDRGGVLRWEGSLEIASGDSTGAVSLEDVNVVPFWDYQAEDHNFVLDSLRLQSQLNYQTHWLGDLRLVLKDSSLGITDLTVLPLGSEDDPASSPPSFIRLAAVFLTGLGMSLADQQVDAASLAISGLDIAGFDRDGVASLQAFLPESNVEGVETEALPPDVEVEAETSATGTVNETDGSGWKLALAELTLDDSRVTWDTEMLTPRAMAVSPITFRANNLHWPDAESAELSSRLRVNDTLEFTLSGALTPSTGEGELRTQLTDLPLPWVNPLVNQQARTDISSGVMGVATDVALADFALASVRVDADISTFSTVLHETGATAFQLAALELRDLQFTPQSQALRIARLALTQPIGSLHILEDGQLNVNGVIRTAPGSTQESESEQTATASTETDTGERENGESDGSDLRVIVEEFTLNDGRLDFADASLPLPFQADIEGINGRLTDLDTQATEPLSLELNGSVDGYAPVEINARGSLQPDSRDMNFGLNFRGIDIANMTPYSGTYAGYEIASGIMSLDLKYGLQRESLNGDNRVVIRQMELGEPVDSEQAVKLPLKLALALLTDSQGVIDLSVPVSGSVDDPKFSLGKVIGRAITNIIVGAATAPFKLLAGLVKSDANLEDIPFAPGAAAPDTTSTAGLDALANALSQRPQIGLRVSGSFSPVDDTASLKEELFQQQLSDAGIDANDVSGSSPAYQAFLLERYTALVANVAADTGSAAGAESGSETGSEAEPDTMAPQQLRKAILDSLALDPNALSALATQRASAAKAYLVTQGGVSPERISISAGLEEDFAGVHMTVAN
ncbi:MAG: DUF748 domain-containing protein [Pseudomonadota bacterium]